MVKIPLPQHTKARGHRVKNRLEIDKIVEVMEVDERRASHHLIVSFASNIGSMRANEAAFLILVRLQIKVTELL